MWQTGAACYATKSAANAASVSSQIGTIVQVSGAPHVVTVDSVDDIGARYIYQPVVGGAPITQTVALDPPSCGLLTLSDVQPIAWAIVAGWMAIYLVKLLWTAGVRDDA